MQEAQQHLETLIADLAGPDAGSLNRTPDGQILVTCPADPRLVVAIEVSPEGERFLFQGFIGTLDTRDEARMLRALLQANFASALMGGPALTLQSEGNAVLTVRSVARKLSNGAPMPAEDFAALLAMFIQSSLEIKQSLDSGSVLGLEPARDGDMPSGGEAFIRV